MPTRLLAAALAVLAFAAVDAVAPAPASAQVQEEPEEAPGVFIVGDSHVQMLGPMLSRELTESGYRVLGYESRPGWSTAAYQRRGDLREVLEAAGRPEVVVVSLGGNDFVGGEASYRRQLEWVVAQAREAGAVQILWVGPATSDRAASELAASTGARHEQNAELQQQILPELGVHWVDSRPCTHDHHGHDGIHFTRDGYRTWSQALFHPVAETVAQLASTEAPAA